MKTQSFNSFGQQYKIILVGDSNVGKTSVFWRFIYNEPLQQSNTTTIDFKVKTIKLHDKMIKICVWDTAGQQKFRSIVATYFKSCEGVVLIFDLSKKETWENIKNVWYDLAFKRVPGAFFLLLGNKKDLPREVESKQILKWCTDKGIYYIQTSAISGQNVQAAFFTLTAMIDSNNEYASNFNSSFSMNVSNEDNTTVEQSQDGKSSTKALYRCDRVPNKIDIASVKSVSFTLKQLRKKDKDKEKVKVQEGCCK